MLLAVGAWWLTRSETLAANEVLVTYENGESCKRTDWSFRYRRAVQNNRVLGNALMVGPPTMQVKDDTTLRVFDASGRKLEIPGEQIRVLVPVASHYFPEQSDDYMSWGNVRLTLAGTVPPECMSSDEIALTSTDHSKKRTPGQITFAGA